ncbi:alpha/beta hydrolase [Streptomyces sp. NPDC026672]|uniref:alpha/beta hydrolase n=1 Tax=unclassified Streptomyces TaxID=2593676 RepID=UPI0033F0B5A6
MLSGSTRNGILPLLADLATVDPEGYAACCDALAAYDLVNRLPRIIAPTLVLGGSHDVATPLPHARELAAGIPGSALRIVATGHLALEQPEAVRSALLAHLRGAALEADGPSPSAVTREDH